jgi:2-dehydro-3-deoxygluconokinase
VAWRWVLKEACSILNSFIFLALNSFSSCIRSLMSNPFVNTKPGAVLCFGELLLRICPDADGKWLEENNLPFYIAGAELNAATALALWGVPAKYFTVLPDNHLSVQVIGYLQKKNIDTSPIFHDGNRIGLYYLTPGKDMKHNALIYDRAHSSFAELKPGTVDWDKVLEGISWFHFSAICPAVSQNAADVCSEVLEAASKKGIIISTDLNYRAKLWQYGKSPRQIMPGLIKYCNLVMGNIWAAETLLGIPAGVNETADKTIYLNAAQKTSAQIMEQYPACKAVANTFRFDADGIRYYGTLSTGDEFYTSAEYQSETIVDKVGSGDCFMAGLIYGFYNQIGKQQTLNFATAAAFKKLFIPGDVTNKSVEEITKAIKL